MTSTRATISKHGKTCMKSIFNMICSTPLHRLRHDQVGERIAARELLESDPSLFCKNCQGAGTQSSWEHGPDFVDVCTRCDGLGVEPS